MLGHEDRLTVEEAARYLRKSTSWLYRNREAEGIRGYKVGGCWQFYKSDLDAYINSRLDGSSPVSRAKIAANNKVILVAS